MERSEEGIQTTFAREESGPCLSNHTPVWPFLTPALCMSFLSITFLMSLFTALHDKIQQALKYGMSCSWEKMEKFTRKENDRR